MKFYVRRENVLVLQEEGGGAKGMAKELRKAKAGGYNAVLVNGALDVQCFRIGKRGEIIEPEEDGTFPDAVPSQSLY